MGWNKRINGKVRITREIYIADMENLLGTDTSHLDLDAYSLTFGTTASILLMESAIGINQMIDELVDHNDTGMSPGDYFLLFVVNRRSDLQSKSGIERWMLGDYASTLYPKKV
ncbi:MAG: hypothetical protein M1327_03370 [Candidatus Thermoplasmatota archaeon]|nr:hypothetical protein [Candidatus Thermoplasmatota archaeon]